MQTRLAEDIQSQIQGAVVARLARNIPAIKNPIADRLRIEPHHSHDGPPKPLSAAGKLALRAITGPDTKGFVTEFAKTWILILAAITAAHFAQSYLFSFIVVVFIATRQNILGLLVHEQSHKLGIRGKHGDLIGNLLCAYPIGITIQGYRPMHMAHHRDPFSDQDPDYIRKQGKERTFPQRVRFFVAAFVKDLLGLSVVKTLKGKNSLEVQGSKLSAQERTNRLRNRVAFYLGLATILTLTGTWTLFLIYWVLPLVTVFQAIIRWGAICEHRYDLLEPTLENSTPLIIPKWWEKSLLPNMNFNYHIYHHWFPAVPFTKLPQAHAICCREGLVNNSLVFDGYGAYLSYLLKQSNNVTK